MHGNLRRNIFSWFSGVGPDTRKIVSLKFVYSEYFNIHKEKFDSIIYLYQVLKVNHRFSIIHSREK